MDDEKIIELFWERAEHAITETSIKYGTYLRTLDNENRIIFIRRYWYTDSISTIANSYGYTESKIKTMLFRMRNKLRIELEKEDIII